MAASHLSPPLLTSGPQDVSQLADSLSRPHLGLVPVRLRHADIEGRH